MNRALAAVLTGAVSACGLAAQVTTELRFSRETPPARRLLASIETTAATIEPGGFGYVTVDLENPDSAPHRVTLRLRATWVYNFSTTRTVALRPGAATTVHMPLFPNPAMRLHLSFAVDGFGDNPVQTVNLASTRGPTFAALLLSDDARDKPGWELALQAHVFHTTTRSRRGSGAAQIHQRVPRRVPREWTLLSGFDLIVLDGAAPGVERDLQQTLRRYVRAGGSLLCLRADSLAEGALTRVFERDGARSEVAGGSEGFGRWLRVGDDSSHALPGGRLASTLERRFEAWIGEVAGDAKAEPGGPVPAGMSLLMRIPGLGEVPVLLFFLLILAFAVVIGPINYFLWWTRRRLTMLLVTVPAIGFGFTGVILVYGLFSEGFGIQGVIRSVTVLDQGTHEAVTWTGRTLYAGLSPSRLSPAANTFLTSPHLFHAGRELRHRLVLDLDADGGGVDGSILPSRTSTSLVTSAQGTQRARLRLRRRDDGGFDVLAGPELRPADTGNPVLLCTDYGRYFVGDATRGLTPIPDSEARKIIQRVWRAFADRLDVDDESNRPMFGHGKASSAVHGRLLGRLTRRTSPGLENGSYLALVDDSPAIDRLGLEVEYLDAAHVVLGRLGVEDIVE